MIVVVSLLCGLIFGFGLLISGMTQPTIVLGFLDVLGPWDPTLAFVMFGALAVSTLGYALARRQSKPIFAAAHLWPTRSDIDRSLVAGSILFGIGWGLVGLCPGPALVNLASLTPQVIVFVIAMGAGMMAKDLLDRRTTAAIPADAAALSTPTDG